MIESSAAGPLTEADVSTVVIYASDFDRMLAFYRDTLGLQVEQQTERYVELRAAGGADIAIHAGREAAVGEGRHWFLEFRVDDLDATARALRARGVDVGDVQERWWGKEAGFTDPEGNRIEVEQPNPEGIRRGPPA